MNLVILAGNSLENFEWAKKIKEILSPYVTTIVMEYDHWINSEKNIDLNKEQKKVINLTQNIDKYIILAKSIGVILAIQSISEQKIRPLKCVFAGTAFNWAKKNNYPVEQWLNNYPIETLFIQNENDPAISFEELRRVINKNNIVNYQIIKLHGDNHKYNADTIAELTKQFLEIK